MNREQRSVPIYDEKELAEGFAKTFGYELYQSYNEKQAADFLRVHPNTLKKARIDQSIGFYQLGERTVAYFGFQLSEYIINHLHPCQNPPLNNDFRWETTGSQNTPDPMPGVEPGTMATHDKPNVRASVHPISRKPSNY